jgi:putative spermidine/putrescine transport system substrate-binding protein
MKRSASSTAISRRRFAGGIVATAAAAASGLARAQGAPAIGRGMTLTVSTWGGVTQDAIKAYVAPEFAKRTGATLAFDIGGQGARFNKLLAQRNNPPADVFFTSDDGIVAGYRAGVLVPAARKNLPNLAELHDWALTIKGFGPDGTVAAAPYALLSLVLAYNPAVLKDKPTSWNDLWRPEVQGKLAFIAPIYGLTPQFAMLANELAGGSPGDLTPGLKKLAELKPVKLTVFWTDWAPLYKTGDVVIAPELDYYLETMKDQGYAIEYAVPRERAIALPEYVGIVKGTKHQELAEAFLNLMMDATVQRAFATKTYQGTVNKTVQLSAAEQARCACGSRVSQLRFFDVAPVVDGRPALLERINTEVVPRWGAR